MSKVLTTKTKIIVKQISSLISGVILCYIFIPLFSALSARLCILVAPRENFTLLLLTGSMLDAIAFCVSGFLTGLIISSFSTNREIRTTVLGSLIVITIFVIQIGFSALRIGWPEPKINFLLTIVVNAICLLCFAIIGAWLISRKRHLQEQKASK